MPRPRKGAAAEYGPRTKLTPEVQKAICDELLVTVPMAHAAGKVGVHRVTISDWLTRGENGEEPYASFAHAVLVAQSTAVCNLVRLSLQGGKGSGNALFHLQKRYPEDFPSSVTRIEHSTPDGDEKRVTQPLFIVREIAAEKAT